MSTEPHFHIHNCFGLKRIFCEACTDQSMTRRAPHKLAPLRRIRWQLDAKPRNRSARHGFSPARVLPSRMGRRSLRSASVSPNEYGKGKGKLEEDKTASNQTYLNSPQQRPHVVGFKRMSLFNAIVLFLQPLRLPVRRVSLLVLKDARYCTASDLQNYKRNPCQGNVQVYGLQSFICTANG